LAFSSRSAWRVISRRGGMATTGFRSRSEMAELRPESLPSRSFPARVRALRDGVPSLEPPRGVAVPLGAAEPPAASGARPLAPLGGFPRG